jgi:hypothetical protein
MGIGRFTRLGAVVTGAAVILGLAVGSASAAPVAALHGAGLPPGAMQGQDESWTRSGLQATLTDVKAGVATTIGYATALSADGTVAVLGAPDGGGDSGDVFVYTRSASGWRQAQVLTVSDTAYAQLGISVGVSADGNTIVAGAEGGGGLAYVFTRSGGTWTQTAEFSSPGGGFGYGFAVAISGDGNTIAVGDDGRLSYEGAVFLYTRTAGGWSGPATLTAPDAGTNDIFGIAVSLSNDGTKIAVGAEGKNDGTVYTFTGQDGTWTPTAALTEPVPSAAHRYARTVALSGNGATLVVGAPDNGNGIAYAYRQSGGTWGQPQVLQASGERDFLADANSVAVSDDGSVIALGLPSRNELYGAAAVFTATSSGFRQSATLVPSESVGDTDGAGTSVSVSGDGATVLLGAPYVTPSFPQGAGFIYRDVDVSGVLNGSAPGTPDRATGTNKTGTQATSALHSSDLPGHHPLLDSGHRTATVCAAATEPGYASCDAQVVTSSSLKPLTASAYTDGYTAAQLETAYGITGKAGSSVVAVVDAYANPDAEASLNTYREQMGLGPASLTQVNEDGGSQLPAADPGWGLEEMLDLEMVSAACPRCSILYVGANSESLDDLGTAVNTAVKMGATVVSNSYGGSEESDEATIAKDYYDHPGVTITASSGDSGYGAQIPAAFGSVVAVGGTSLTLNSDGTRASETVWNFAGSGCSRFIAKPSWQHDSYCANRTIADVAAVADPNTGVAIYDEDYGGWTIIGGTSVSAPFIAGIYGLAGPVQGPAAKRLYEAPKKALYDVTSGQNGTCSKAYLCTAKPGYDGPTGMGSPNGMGAF